MSTHGFIVESVDLFQRRIYIYRYIYTNNYRFSFCYRSKRNLLVGAPGYEDWRGKTLQFEPQSNEAIETSPTRGSASYSGYSVANIMIDKVEYIVQGAPRAGNKHGESYIYICIYTCVC